MIPARESAEHIFTTTLTPEHTGVQVAPLPPQISFQDNVVVDFCHMGKDPYLIFMRVSAPPRAAHTIKTLISFCDSIWLRGMRLIFPELLLHDKQASGEHPRQNVNDIEGEIPERPHTVYEPINLNRNAD